jgi:2'-5' RNA ligase
MSFIGLRISHEVARMFSAIDVPGKKVPLEEMHVTSLYLGKNIPLETIGRAVVASAEVAEATRPFRLAVERRTSFPVGDDGVPIICPVQSPELHDLNARLRAALDKHGVEYSKKFTEYKPHVTLAYAEEEIVDEPVGPLEWSAYEMVMWGGDAGDERLSATFPFAFPKKAATERKLLKLFAAMKS